MYRANRIAKTLSTILAVCLLGLAACGPDTDTDADASLAEALAVTAPTSTPPRFAISPTVSREDPGVFDDRIVFGQSAAFTGPAGQLGIGMNHGIQAAFAEVNRAGGVNGRLLELVTRDDTYEPELAIANTTELIEVENVFALIGAVGTPTSRSAVPVAEAAGVPYIAPFTGAAFLRDPKLRSVINLRSSYNQETEEMVERLTEDLGIERIAVMYQDDSFGRAGFNGAKAALDRRYGSDGKPMKPVAVGLYQRNTTAVKTGLLDVRKGNPEAVIVIGAYQPVAAVIAWAREIGMNPVFMTVSFVGSNALAEELGGGGEGVIVTQVVPFPTDTSNPVVAAYQEALAEYDPGVEPGFVSLEGYMAGRLAIAGLERCGDDVTRACFLSLLRIDRPINMSGLELNYSQEEGNQWSDEVFLTMIGDEGQYIPLDVLPKDVFGSEDK